MSCGNGWFKKNPWLAERSQVTTRWGKKSPTFDDGDDSMEVFPLNANVCVFVCVYTFLITNWPPAHMRTHSHSSACWFLSQSQTLHCKFLSPHAAQTVAETQNTSGKKTLAAKMENKTKLKNKQKIKFAALNVLEHHIESLGVTIF